MHVKVCCAQCDPEPRGVKSGFHPALSPFPFTTADHPAPTAYRPASWSATLGPRVCISSPREPHLARGNSFAQSGHAIDADRGKSGLLSDSGEGGPKEP